VFKLNVGLFSSRIAFYLFILTCTRIRNGKIKNALTQS